MGNSRIEESSPGPSESGPALARQAPYLLFVLGASILALVVFVFGRIVPMSPEQRRVLELVDLALCVVFLFDFILTLATAEDRWRYLRTWGWFDLLSAIPVVGPLRLARGARVVRVLRILRAFRVARVLLRSLSAYRAQTGLAGAAIVALIALLFGSFAVLEVEQGPGVNIQSAEDALWWSLTTITTVGYGDRFPVTSEGRLAGAFLMVVGVGLFGTLTAFLATVFVQSGETRLEHELSEIRAELARLNERLGAGKE